MKKTLFDLLLRPLETVLASMSTIIDQEAKSKKLFFADFVRKLLFAYLEQVSSLRSLEVELKTNEKCQALELTETAFSTFKDGFYRFQSKHFKQLFETVLGSLDFKRIKCLDEIGLFRVIDGSLFPTLIQMGWSEYRKRKNAFKLHLEFELNRMLPVEFLIGSGKSSERDVLATALEAGVTYIADRGYASFKIIAKLFEANACFIFRIKDNWLFEVERVSVNTDSQLPLCFRNPVDQIVKFTNDEHKNTVRLIQFAVAGSKFKLLTNRFDLSIAQIIILYAYRWQIELFFKYFKRTLKGLHLFNHSQNGVEIQFYLLMTLALLLLQFKQKNQWSAKAKPERDKYNEANASEWIKKVSEIFYESWKISKKWLLIIRNSLSKIPDHKLLTMLNSC